MTSKDSALIYETYKESIEDDFLKQLQPKDRKEIAGEEKTDTFRTMDGIISGVPIQKLQLKSLLILRDNGLIDFNNQDVWFTQKGVNFIYKHHNQYYDSDNKRMSKYQPITVKSSNKDMQTAVDLSLAHFDKNRSFPSDPAYINNIAGEYQIDSDDLADEVQKKYWRRYLTHSIGLDWRKHVGNMHDSNFDVKDSK